MSGQLFRQVARPVHAGERPGLVVRLWFVCVVGGAEMQGLWKEVLGAGSLVCLLAPSESGCMPL